MRTTRPRKNFSSAAAIPTKNSVSRTSEYFPLWCDFGTILQQIIGYHKSNSSCPLAKIATWWTIATKLIHSGPVLSICNLPRGVSRHTGPDHRLRYRSDLQVKQPYSYWPYASLRLNYCKALAIHYVTHFVAKDILSVVCMLSEMPCFLRWTLIWPI